MIRPFTTRENEEDPEEVLQAEKPIDHFRKKKKKWDGEQTCIFP